MSAFFDMHPAALRAAYDAKAPDTVMLFRVGDFWEALWDDAGKVAAACGLRLTARGEIPMCGIVYHQLDAYVAKLTAAGWKVATCEEVSRIHDSVVMDVKETPLR